MSLLLFTALLIAPSGHHSGCSKSSAGIAISEQGIPVVKKGSKGTHHAMAAHGSSGAAPGQAGIAIAEQGMPIDKKPVKKKPHCS